ncbi:hypothetical protein [Lysobacter tyrosinilyticus]
MKRAVIWAALAAALAMSAGTVNAARADQTTVRAGSLSPSQRGEMAKSFVMRWGTYVQKVYGMDVHVWAKRMVGTFVQADPTNFKHALQRSTYEGAMAELDGRGRKLSDNKVITKLAMSTTGTISPSSAADGIEDLVYTPLEPCRVVDTRNTGAGAITGGTSRGFYAWGFDSFAPQGGSATDCGGLLAQAPQAIVVNVTVVGQTELGYATLYPAAAAAVPTTATMIYYPNVILSNAATVTLGSVGETDFSIFSQRTANYIVDIVGYYDFPHAIEPECAPQFISQNIAASANFDFAIPSCAAGFALTGANCRTLSVGQASWATNGLMTSNEQVSARCAGTNLTGGQITVEGTAQCCRVPGR